jgi:hypothetical protein
VLRRDFAGLVGELPWRISDYRGEAPFADELEQIKSHGIHETRSGSRTATNVGTARNNAVGAIQC